MTLEPKSVRVDVMGSSALDLVPRFLPPIDLLPSLKTVNGVSLKGPFASEAFKYWEGYLPNYTTLINIVDEMKVITTALQNRHDQDNWDDPNFVGLVINQISYKLLHFKQKIDKSIPGTTIQEVCRLAVHLLVDNIIRCFGCGSHLTSEPAQRLFRVLSQSSVEWLGLEKVFIWVLILGGMGTENQNERSWFADRVGETSRKLGLNTFHDAKVIAADFLWVSIACDAECEAFRQNRFEQMSNYVELVPG
jgi:hypothetical protein